MVIDWAFLGKFVPFVRPAAVAAKAGWDRARGTSPKLDFKIDDGLQLDILNTQDETIIIERIVSDPPVLGFAAGHSVREIARAVIDQRGADDDGTLAIVGARDRASMLVVTFDRFNELPVADTIKVSVSWRRATRGLFSRSRVTRKIAVRDVRDLKDEADRRRRA